MEFEKQQPHVNLLVGDCIEQMRTLPDQSIHTCVTSPPYFGLRDYGVDGQIGLEDTPDAFVQRLVEVFREVRRVLRDDGTLWVNLGDSYSTKAFATGMIKAKDLVGIPWRVAFALQQDGWYLRQEIIWHKSNPMPESVRDRCTKSHEQIFLLTKNATYAFDHEAIKEPSVTNDPRRPYTSQGAKALDGRAEWKSGQSREKADFSKRNRRSVWSVPVRAFKGAHFATFPPDLIEPCILAGSPIGGTVLDPFGGSGTTAGVAIKHGRNAVLCEINTEYAALVPERIRSIAGDEIGIRETNSRPVANNDNFVDGISPWEAICRMVMGM